MSAKGLHVTHLVRDTESHGLVMDGAASVFFAAAHGHITAQDRHSTGTQARMPDVLLCLSNQ